MHQNVRTKKNVWHQNVRTKENEKTWGANKYYIVVSRLQQAESTNIVYHAQKKQNT